jgi:hypothetical protein
MLFGSLVLLVSLQASAGVVLFANRASFNALGTIAYNSNFDDFQGAIDYPGDKFTRGDVTYTSSRNVIFSDCTFSISCARSVIANDNFTPVTGTIGTDAHHYNLFGFNLAATGGFVNFTVTTNLANYTYIGKSVPNGDPAFAFEGFQATGPGEYFTGFRIDTADDALSGLTDVAVGLDRPPVNVPEPGTLALMGLAMAGLVRVRRGRAG